MVTNSVPRRIFLLEIAAVLAAVLFLLVSMRSSNGIAEATNYWTGLQTASDTQEWCYDSGLPSQWKNAYFAASMQWNGSPSDWTLDRKDSCNYFKASRWSFAGIGWPNDPGRTVFAWSGSTITIAFSFLNTDMNWDLSMQDGASMGSDANRCSPACEPWTIMLHEMGHWVQFGHGGCSTSTMCVDWTVRRYISSHDSSSLITIYGP